MPWSGTQEYFVAINVDAQTLCCVCEYVRIAASRWIFLLLLVLAYQLIGADATTLSCKTTLTKATATAELGQETFCLHVIAFRCMAINCRFTALR